MSSATGWSKMDRLFDLDRSGAEDRGLQALAQAELTLQHRRRARRVLVAATAASTLLCWTYVRFGSPALLLGPFLFAVFGSWAIALAIAEHLASRRLARSLLRLPPEIRDRLDERPDRLEIRRGLAIACALTGLFPFVRAVAPRMPAGLWDGGRLLWGTLVVLLLCATVEQELLTPSRRR